MDGLASVLSYVYIWRWVGPRGAPSSFCPSACAAAAPAAPHAPCLYTYRSYTMAAPGAGRPTPLLRGSRGGGGGCRRRTVRTNQTTNQDRRPPPPPPRRRRHPCYGGAAAAAQPLRQWVILNAVILNAAFRLFRPFPGAAAGPLLGGGGGGGAPPNPGDVSEIPWDFFLTVPPGGARAGRARRGAGVVVLSFLGHGMAGES